MTLLTTEKFTALLKGNKDFLNAGVYIQEDESTKAVQVYKGNITYWKELDSLSNASKSKEYLDSILHISIYQDKEKFLSKETTKPSPLKVKHLIKKMKKLKENHNIIIENKDASCSEYLMDENVKFVQTKMGKCNKVILKFYV